MSRKIVEKLRDEILEAIRPLSVSQAIVVLEELETEIDCQKMALKEESGDDTY